MEENQNIPEVQPIENNHLMVASGSKREWTSYIKEFIMLFLAVFAGFLAENYRDTLSEKSREKVYIKNMLDDLKSDTTAYQKYASDNKLVFSTIDSLVYFLKSPQRNQRAERIYFLARTLSMRADLLFTYERTYEQMKSSGHLRLISSQEVADSVSIYYNSLKQVSNQNNRISARIDEYFLVMNKLFDAEVFLNILKDKKEPESKSVKLLTEDHLVINEVLMRAQYLYGTFSFASNWGIERCKKAENLITLIQKEYHITE